MTKTINNAKAEHLRDLERVSSEMDHLRRELAEKSSLE